MIQPSLARFLLIHLAWFLPVLGFSQFEKVEIETIEVAENIYMLQGSGGNIGLSVGEDGPLLIDDQFAPLTEKILTAVAKVSDHPVRFVVNTHWHGDHTGGNEKLGKKGAIIVAHENVRVRLSKGQFMKAFNRHVNPAPPKALPVVTFTESLKLHWNGDTLHVQHHPTAHTDGDATVRFANANVLHTGDLFFNGFYPFVDASSGGSLPGLLSVLNQLLESIDEDTIIIPGHGPLAAKSDLEAYLAMLSDVRSRMKTLIEAGKTREEIIASKPTASYDERWGGGFLKPDVWVGVIYDAMQSP